MKDKDQNQIMDMAILLKAKQIQKEDKTGYRNVDKKQKEVLDNQQKIYIGNNYVLKVPFKKQSKVLHTMKHKNKFRVDFRVESDKLMN